MRQHRQCMSRHAGFVQCTSLLILFLIVWLVALSAASTTVAALSFAPSYHLYEPQLYVYPPSGLFRDVASGNVHVYMPCTASELAGASTSWCHASSSDYVTWERDVDAVPLSANKWYDKGGVRAGTFMLNALGEPTAMYTCVDQRGTQQQCIAGPATQDVLASRRFDRLYKCPLNPVVTPGEVPGLINRTSLRDPTSWWRSPDVAEDDVSRWLVGLGAAIRDDASDRKLARPHVVVFTTNDPSFEGGYEYSHSLYTDGTSLDDLFEHPDFFVTDDPVKMPNADARHFLKLSSPAARRDYVLQGSYAPPPEGGPAVFTADAAAAATWLDAGVLYGAKTFWDPVLRRRLLWGWVPEELTDQDARALGWGGVQTLREVQYNATDKTLRFPPAPQWKALREAVRFNGTISLTQGSNAVEVLSPSTNLTRHHEIIAEFTFPREYMDSNVFHADATTVPEVGLRLRANEGATQYVAVSLRMPVAQATPSRCYAQSRYPFQEFTLPDVANDTALCQAACDATPLCAAWNRVTKVYENVCVLCWQPSEPEQNCSATSGRPNVPMLSMSRNLSGTLGFNTTLEGRAPLSVGTPWTMRLHIFVDDSVIEVYKDDGKECLTARVYLNDESQQGIWVYARNMPLEAVSVNVRVFSMGTIWRTSNPPSAVERYANTTYELLSALVSKG